jgi:choline dehydrogenase-like flavoprotein
MADGHYDVVIVGAGMVSAILAKQLAAKKRRVLILEAGTKDEQPWRTYRSYLDNYFLSLAKTPNSPYPNLLNAPSPSVLDITAVHGETPDTNGYFVQRGPQPFGSNYLRAYGGTTLHWLGTCLRMLPHDFEMRTRFDRGIDWPSDVRYEQLEKYYEKAEWEIGVSGEKDEQAYLGITFGDDYDFPMQEIPSSFVDRYIGKAIDGMEIRTDDGETFNPQVTNTPQGRNSTPRPDTSTVAGVERGPYEPRGASGAYAFMGQRCEGNSSCIPICPVQAKYNATKTLSEALKSGCVEVLHQSVASQVETDPASGRVTAIAYKHYDFPGVAQYQVRRVTGDVYVLAAGAVENVKIGLASDLCRTSGELGRNLMDHPYVMTWGLARDHVGPFRGPGSTSGIPTFRDGEFRRSKAAFRLEIGNWGWNFSAGAPNDTVTKLVDEENLYGADLKKRLFDEVQRQVRIGILVEQLPEATNTVTIDPAYLDAMGEYRPVISYDISDYTRAGIALAVDVCRQMYRRLGVYDHTAYDSAAAGYLTYMGKGYTCFGSGHLVGTHRMGEDRKTSVTDSSMRAWDHDNLWMVGCGSMPTIATSNPTLTMAALAFKAAESVDAALG